MINLNVFYRNRLYEIIYHNGEFYPKEYEFEVEYKLMSYYISLWRKTGTISTGNCVVCYEDNKIGSYMGCCNNKQFLCVSCIDKMYKAKQYDCPCCRNSMLPVLSHRMKNQPSLFDKYTNNHSLELLDKHNHIKRVISDLENLILPDEEELTYYEGYDYDSHTLEFQINDTIVSYFWNKKSRIHFNKVLKKIGYRPFNSVKKAGKMRTVME